MRNSIPVLVGGFAVIWLLASGYFPPSTPGHASSSAPALPEWISAERDVHYDRLPETTADVLWSKARDEGLRPGAVVIHGGWWSVGERTDMIRDYCLSFLEQGFVVMNIDYRLRGTAKAPAAVQDALSAVRWFSQKSDHYRVDPGRIVAVGFSSGGHLALMAGMLPKSAGFGEGVPIRAILSFAGVTDLLDLLEGPNQRGYVDAWLPPGKDRERLARQLSPLSYVRPTLPPIIAVHGDQDNIVPYSHSVRLIQALKEKGADAQLITVPQGSHGLSKRMFAEVYSKVFESFRAHGILRK